MELVVPPRDQIGSVGGDDLVGTGVRPRTTVPRAPQLRAWLLSWVVGPPFGFVAIDVAHDLRRALTESADVRRELLDLARLVERVSARRERVAELRLAHHRSVTDAVDRLDAVADADGVQSAPRALREHPSVDLKVQVTMRVTCPRGVVTNHRRLDLLHGHLDLAAARSNARGRVLGDPLNDLVGCARLRGVVRGGDVGVKGGDERPGLGAVDDDLDESQGVVVVAQAALRLAAVNVVARDPSFVVLAGHDGGSLGHTLRYTSLRV